MKTFLLLSYVNCDVVYVRERGVYLKTCLYFVIWSSYIFSSFYISFVFSNTVLQTESSKVQAFLDMSKTKKNFWTSVSHIVLKLVIMNC